MEPYYNNKREYESNLSEARIQAGLTIAELCAKVDIHPAVYTGLNSGMTSPMARDGSIKPAAQLLADTFVMELSDLFPRYFCELNKHDGLFDDEVIEYFHPGLLSNEYDDPELKLLAQEKADMINHLFSKLSDAECLVVKLRYLHDVTLEDIGKRIGRSRERIRQLEKDGIRRMRYHMHRVKDCKFLFEELV